MFVKKYLTQCMIVIYLIGLGCLQASEISVSTRIVSVPDIPGDPSLISITVSNDTTNSIHNVDLRLARSEVMIGGNGVLQFGTVAASGFNTVEAEIFPASSDGSLPDSIVWKVDYDDVAGSHLQNELITVLGAEE